VRAGCFISLREIRSSEDDFDASSLKSPARGVDRTVETAGLVTGENILRSIDISFAARRLRNRLRA
jgi:hypothetical protein